MTTIVSVRRNGQVVIGGDGQATLGNTVMKGNVKKVRRLYNDKVIAGFAGGTADAFTLFELFERKLEMHQGHLVKAAVELAKDWRTDRMPDSEVDVMYGIGGAPEGVISAAVIRALDGDMQARLLPRHQVKEDNDANRRIGEQELARCKEMGIEAGKVLLLDDMARNDNVIFAATGITKGDLLEGISRQGNMATTETLLIRGKSRTIRRIRSTHYLDRKDPALHPYLL